MSMACTRGYGVRGIPGSIWVCLKGRFLWPFCFSPVDDDIAHTESVSVLGAIMLNDSFESIESLGTFASVAIAEEKFFPVFC
jgi:hypothetical protein